MRTFSPCNFWIWNKFALVIMNHDSICTLDEAKVFLALNNERDRVFQIKYMRSIPIRNVIDIALSSCGSNQISISNRHVNNSIFEIKMLSEINVIRQNISHLNSILVIQICFPVIVGDLFVDYLTEYHISVTTSSCTKSSVSWPNKFFNRTAFCLVERVSPTCLVTYFEHSKSTYRKVFSVRTPWNWAYNIIIRSWGIEKPSLVKKELP